MFVFLVRGGRYQWMRRGQKGGDHSTKYKVCQTRDVRRGWGIPDVRRTMPIPDAFVSCSFRLPLSYPSLFTVFRISLISSLTLR
jgi:hypothetical protein